MKKLCYSVFIAFWSSIVTLLALHSLADDDAPAVSSQTFSLNDVAQHNTLKDCWMVIEGKVYDISAYVDKHPAPPSVLEPWCGKEASKGMRTKGYGNDHSAGAWNLLSQYLIGELDN